MDREEFKTIIMEVVSECFETHRCFLSQEEKQLTKDLLTGARLFKRSIIIATVGFILAGIGLVGFGFRHILK